MVKNRWIWRCAIWGLSLLGGCSRCTAPGPADSSTQTVETPSLVINEDLVELPEGQPTEGASLPGEALFQQPLWGEVERVVLDPQGRFLIACDGYGAVAIVDLESGALRTSRQFFSGYGHLPDIDFAYHGQRLLLGFTAADYTEAGSALYHWDLGTNLAEYITSGYHQGLYAYALSPDGEAVGYVDFGDLALERLVAPRSEVRVESTDRSPVRLALTASKQRLFSQESISEAPDELVVRDAATLQPVQTYPGVELEMMAARPAGGAIVTVDEDHRVLVRGSLDGRVLGELGQPEQGVNKAAYSPDGREIALWLQDEKVLIYDGLTGALRGEHQLQPDSKAPAPLWVQALNGEAGLKALNISTTAASLRRTNPAGSTAWELAAKGKTLRIHGQQWAREGQELILWSEKTVLLWSPEGLRSAPRPAGFVEAIRQRGGSPRIRDDLFMIPSAGSDDPAEADEGSQFFIDRFVKRSEGPHALRIGVNEEMDHVSLYDASEGRVLRLLKGLRPECFDYHCRPLGFFSPDWQWLAVEDVDGNVRVFEVSTGRQTALLEVSEGSQIFDILVLNGGRGLACRRNSELLVQPLLNGRLQGEAIHLAGEGWERRAAFNLGGDLVLAAESGEELVIWNGQGQEVRRLPITVYEGSQDLSHLSDDGSLLVRLDSGTSVSAYLLPSGERIVLLGRFVGLAPDGSAAYLCDESQRLNREVLRPERRTVDLGPCQSGAVAHSADGRFFSVQAGDQVWLYALDGGPALSLTTYARGDSEPLEHHSVMNATDGRYWVEERSLPYFRYREAGPLLTARMVEGAEMPRPVAAPAALGFGPASVTP